MSSLSRFNPLGKLFTPPVKIHPEVFDSVMSNLDVNNTSLSIEYKDPCAKMYARYKEPGAYEGYRQHLLMSTMK
jgi:hypothetical protein